VNTALSAGIGEIIDVAMAKNREDRYQSTLDMLEDLNAVRRGEPPTHARRAVHLDGLERLEETGKTVDIAPAGGAAFATWTSPSLLTALGVAGVSLILNIILLVMYLTK
jgi:eukaryotic-like serine/threonine-protein kinase